MNEPPLSIDMKDIGETIRDEEELLASGFIAKESDDEDSTEDLMGSSEELADDFGDDYNDEN